MDPRRSVIPRLLAAQLILLPVACAEAPRPMLVGVQPINTFELAPPTAQPVLRKVTLRRIAWLNCGTGRPKRLRARACSPPPSTAVAATAPKPQPLAAPRLTPAVYIRPVQATPATVPPTPVAYRKPSSTPIIRPIDPGARDRMDGAIKVFAYEPGRVYAVAAAPLRVTTLSLQPGETLVDKAAGDTVRWEIGETTSGSGAAVRTLVMLKPLTAGLSTNMVLTTSQRVYLIDLSSIARHADRAIAWSYPPAPQATAISEPPDRLAPPSASAPAASAADSAQYRITPQGRRPTWTPQLVFDDGHRTFIAFGPELDRRPSPLLFVTDGGGQPALVNYRQDGGLYVVDRLFDRAELRLGGDHPEIVRIVRVGGRS